VADLAAKNLRSARIARGRLLQRMATRGYALDPYYRRILVKAAELLM
jgi:hypothetical protein